MSAISPTYADLGGGLDAPRPRPRVHESRTIDRSPGRVCDRHLFDPMSGWCGCGLRDDGRTAPGSPAWRAAVDRTMPGGSRSATPSDALSPREGTTPPTAEERS